MDGKTNASAGGNIAGEFGTEKYCYSWNGNFSPQTYNVTKGKIYTFAVIESNITTNNYALSNVEKIKEYFAPWSSGLNTYSVGTYMCTFKAKSNAITISGAGSRGWWVLS